MIQNPQNNPNRHWNLITSSLDNAQPIKVILFTKIRRQLIGQDIQVNTEFVQCIFIASSGFRITEISEQLSKVDQSD